MRAPFRFFVGLHQPADALHFQDVCISVNRLRRRRSPFPLTEDGSWLMDSGAFTEVSRHGGYRTAVRTYADEIRRWSGHGRLLAAAAQDWMCEPAVLARTDLNVRDHQRLTVERYDALLDEAPGVPVMPVLQGWAPDDYRRHLDLYADRLPPGAWVGVGTLCRRNGAPEAVWRVLSGIARERPDLALHGFGLKLTALAAPQVLDLLASADSLAWSYAARCQGRDPNNWREAARFTARVEALAADRGSDRHLSRQRAHAGGRPARASREVYRRRPAIPHRRSAWTFSTPSPLPTPASWPRP